MSEFHFLGSAQIPKGWELRRLKHVGTVLSGTGFPHDYQGNEDGEFPFLKVSDLSAPGSEKWVSYAANTVDREMAKELGASIVPENSIIYAKIGAALLLNKRRLLSRPSCIDNNMSAFVPKIVLPEWALWWMTILDFSEYVNPGAIPSFTEGQQKELPFLVPPLKTQRRIADYLDRETARIDALIAEKEKMLALLEEKRTALISRAVTRGLNPDAPMKPSGLDWLGDIPAHWKTTHFKFVCEVGPKVDVSDISSDDVVTFLPMDRIKNGYFIKNTVAFSKYNTSYNLFAEGDIVLAKVTPCFENGNIAITENLENNIGFGTSEIFVIRPIKADQRYIFYYLQCDPFKKQGEASMTGAGGLKRVSPDFVRRHIIALPQLDEQKAIAEYLDKVNIQIKSVQMEIMESVRLLKEHRFTLITTTVTGNFE